MKQEIIYVQITECSEEYEGLKNTEWHEEMIGRYVPVVESSFADCFIVPGTTIIIPKSDCRRVYLQEQAMDIDGEPLECGDKVFIVGVYNKNALTYCGKHEHKYICWIPERNDYADFDKIRKVKPEQPAINNYIEWMEELIKKYGTEADYLAVEEIKKALLINQENLIKSLWNELKDKTPGYYDSSEEYANLWAALSDYINKEEKNANTN